MTSSHFKFLRRVRIHDGDCGAVARALHHAAKFSSLPAASEKVSYATQERKVMSKKTFFKRIALSAIAALGLGMLSVAPSQAAVTNLSFAVADGTSTLTAGYKSDSTTAATITVSALLDNASDTITVSFVEKSKPTGAAAIARLYYNESTTPAASTTLVDTPTLTAGVGASATSGNAGLTTAYLSGSDSLTGELAGADNVFRIRSNGGGEYVGAKFFLQLESETARIKGTYTYTVLVKVYEKGSANPGSLISTSTKDVSITIADTAANIALTGATAIDPSKTTAILNTGDKADGAFTAVDSSIAVVATADGTIRASLQVKTYTAASNPAPESVTVTITGPGLVRNSTATTVAGKSLTVTGSGGNTIFDIISDGTAGVASIVVKTTTVTFPAKTMTFYAKAAKTITVSAYQPVIKVGTNTDVVRATAVDADGNVWGGTAYIYAGTAADALIAGSATTPVACTFDPALGVHKCPVTGTAKGTANLKVIDAATVALATATSDAAAVRVSTGVASSINLSFDKATYAPGDRAQLRIQVLDAEGLAMPAKTITDGFATGGITANVAFGTGSAPTTDLDDVSFDLSGSTSAATDTNAGHKTYVVYMPSNAGTVTVSATAGAGIAIAGRVALSASASVVKPTDPEVAAAQASAEAASDAALEAIDAANAATDAANLAAEAADAATVAAEEARDAADAATAAVEALASEVATLMAALKAQITTLAKTVAKIAKKVKA